MPPRKVGTDAPTRCFFLYPIKLKLWPKQKTFSKDRFLFVTHCHGKRNPSVNFYEDIPCGSGVTAWTQIFGNGR